MMNSKYATYFAGRQVWQMLCVVLLASCSTTKNIPQGDALYTGAQVKVTEQTGQEKISTGELGGLIRPKPNASLLGWRYKLGIYNLAGKGNKGLNKILKKWGEPPVLLSQFNLERNTALLKNTLENRGYFHTDVVGDTTIKGKKASATFTVQPGPQYTIHQVVYPQDSISIGRSIRNMQPNSLLKPGNPFFLQNVTDERLRIDANLKELGFYYFNPEHLVVWVDSTIGNNQVDLYLRFKPDVPPIAKERYFINNVYIYSNYNLSSARRDTTFGDTVSFRGYNVIASNHLFKPEVFDRVMRFNPGDIYSRIDHNVTLARLINLGVLKFVKNRFDPLPNENKLDAYYYLTPLPKKSLSLEVGGLTKSNNVTGSEISVKWRNRNAFKGAELLTANVYFGTEVQYAGQFSGYNTLRYGGEVSLAYPRFMVPIFRFNTKGSFVPRTAIKLGYDVLNRQKLFALNSFRGEFGYIWRDNARTEHRLNPISINYVRPQNVTSEYRSLIASKPLLQRAIDRQFILGSNYNFNYNQLADKEKYASGSYFNGMLDLSGNVAGLLTGANAAGNDTSKILGVPFSQFIKTELDYRYYQKIGKRHQLANRIIVGVGLPWGNSTILPYAKQFFMGGNNSLRAFRSRSVGPGASPDGQNTGTGQVLPDMTGDIKLELNTELRLALTELIGTAFFVDAGNIWLYNRNPQQPKGQFSSNFLKELAVGTGLGFRLDLTILLLRLDLAIPLRKPFLPEGQRWVINKIDLGSSDWRKENIVFNLAIGYPF